MSRVQLSPAPLKGSPVLVLVSGLAVPITLLFVAGLVAITVVFGRGSRD